MSATEQYNTPSTTKMRLMAQLKAWRDAEENPIGEDGKPAPLRMVVLRVHNLETPLIPGIAVTAKTELPVLADKIIRKMKEWANGTQTNGETLVGDLHPYFGNNSEEGQGHYAISIKPDRTAFGSEAPLVGDLGNTREASAVIIRESITHGRDVMQFAGAVMGKTDERTDRIIDSLEKQLEKAYARIAALESGADRVRGLENDLADKKLDRDLKSRENDMKMKVMESAGNKLIDYIPLFTSKLDQYMVSKFGGGQQLTDEGKFYKSVVEVILSKVKNTSQLKAVVSALNLTEEDVKRIESAGSKLQLEEKRGAMHEEAKALGRGGPVRSIRKLLPARTGGGSIPTIPNPSRAPTPPTSPAPGTTTVEPAPAQQATGT